MTKKNSPSPPSRFFSLPASRLIERLRCELVNSSWRRATLESRSRDLLKLFLTINTRETFRGVNSFTTRIYYDFSEFLTQFCKKNALALILPNISACKAFFANVINVTLFLSISKITIVAFDNRFSRWLLEEETKGRTLFPSAHSHALSAIKDNQRVDLHRNATSQLKYQIKRVNDLKLAYAYPAVSREDFSCTFK